MNATKQSAAAQRPNPRLSEGGVSMLKSIFKRLEKQMLKTLLVRFILNQLENPNGRASELVDCATVLVDEVCQ